MTVNPQDIIINEDNELLTETEMAEELAYDAAVFEEAMRDMLDDPDYEPQIEREGLYH